MPAAVRGNDVISLTSSESYNSAQCQRIEFKWRLKLLTGLHPTMWFDGKTTTTTTTTKKTGSILVMGWNALSNVTTTACLLHMCPHLSLYAEYVILSSPLLHQCRFTVHTWRRGMLSENAVWNWGGVVYNYLLQCISLWKLIHGGRGGGEKK